MPASVSKSVRNPDPTNTPAQPAERAAPLTGTTPDLFAEDIERATLQAMNTDIRQGTLAGFELPEVFMAAVASGACGQAEPAMKTQRGKLPDAEKTQPDGEQHSFDMLEGFDSPRSIDENKDDDSTPMLLAAAWPEHAANQRASSTAYTRHLKTMLTIIVCAMLVTVATGIAQTLLLMRMNRDSVRQQHRIEQLMLNQEATLSALFDTDSANVGTMKR